MRRERKTHYRRLYLADAFARWQLNEDINDRITEFKNITEATDSELTQFALALESLIVKYMQDAFATARALKPGTIRNLCQRLSDLEERKWNKLPLISRFDEFNDILRDMKYHYEDLIVETAVNFYLSLLSLGSSYEEVQNRIKKSVDVYVVIGKDIYVWDNIIKRVTDAMAIATGHVKGELQVFVEDNQNIHTGPVNTQTSESLKLILDTPVPDRQKTLEYIEEEWWGLLQKGKLGDDASFVDILKPIRDMRWWASKSHVVANDDFLYKKVLRHLWAKIRTYPNDIREELIRRLYEECRDAISMCAQGHIARLANVLVGFDAAFKPPVSLQDKMADISRLDVTEEEKRAAASLVLDEFRVAAADRAAWLDAF